MLKKQFEKRTLEAIGIMSGTSLDGIDLVHVKITYEEKHYHYQQLAFKTYPYQQTTREEILKQSNNQTSFVQGICSLNKQIGLLYVEALSLFIAEFNIDIDAVSFIASHGQTIWHNPNQLDGFHSSTLQIGDANGISYYFNKLVICDFRQMDMAANGEGAPLVPMSEFILFKSDQCDRILVNIGGISNLTYLPQKAQLNDLIAFDTGPGNMLIDLACQKFYQVNYDKDAQYAKKGTVNQEILTFLKSDPYLKKDFPKSTGREKYGNIYLANLTSTWPNIMPNDLIATLTAFTAELIIDQINYFFPNFHLTGQLIVSGGGANNPYLLKRMKEYFKGTCFTLNEIGYDVDAKEAIAFVILGHLRLLNIPSNVPSATNAEKHVCLGTIILPTGGNYEY